MLAPSNPGGVTWLVTWLGTVNPKAAMHRDSRARWPFSRARFSWSLSMYASKGSTIPLVNPSLGAAEEVLGTAVLDRVGASCGEA